MPTDYPSPRARSDHEEFIWDEDELPINNYCALGQRLAAAGDVYRRPSYAGGLLLAADQSNIPPRAIESGRQLAGILVDRVRVRVRKDGNTKGSSIPAAHLNTMLASEVFLQQFRPVDDVLTSPQYVADFQLTKPGYNDFGSGQRYLYFGPKPEVEHSLDAVNAFLNVMAFATNADRTNAVAAALTVMLRHFWPGTKPLILVTATKSHAGKDTVIAFATGNTPHVSISYQATDWALERSFVGALKHDAATGVVIIENARLARGQSEFASAFLERVLTDPNPLFFSTGTGQPVRRQNHLVLAMSTQFGTVSGDKMNRALPIYLDLVGNVADRKSPIGNPRWEYLPANRDRIEAELRGMIERWLAAGRPLDMSVKHPFTDWARTIGGILRVSGFSDFLGNYSLRRTADDPVRRALGILGAARPGQWLRADAWARLAVQVGVAGVIIAPNDRNTDKGRERGMGVVLSHHRDETFVVESEDERVTLRLDKARQRAGQEPEPKTRYRFLVLETTRIPEYPVKDEQDRGKPGDGQP